MLDVSIILPVYNTERYLEDCLRSLVNQNYDKNKYEILAINDCSKDNSLKILNKYKKKYDNIVIINLKENKGVSHARNIGIEKSKGEYLLFCDSDDFYDRGTLKTLMTKAQKQKADFVMANYYIYKENKKIPVNATNYFSGDVVTKNEIISYMTLTSCSKLIRKKLFINNNIFYPEDLKKCEELPVIPLLAYKANKVITIPDNLYYYVQRKNSASNERYKNIKLEDLEYFDLSFIRFVELIDEEKYKDEIVFRAIDHLLYGKCLVMLKSHISRKKIIKYIDDFNSIYNDFTKNKYLKKYNKAKKIFILLLKNKLIFSSRILSYIHGRITG